MRILVAYATKYGATQGIAERIAGRLDAAGHEAAARHVSAIADVADYDACVVGSAAFFGKWQKEAHEFVQRNLAVLAERPTWLFSSGPVGSEPLDAKGRDLRAMAEPTDFAVFRGAIRPRGERVFFGAFDAGKLPLLMKAMRILPASRAVLPEGDFRDWADIETWADEIAASLAPVPVVRA